MHLADLPFSCRQVVENGVAEDGAGRVDVAVHIDGLAQHQDDLGFVVEIEHIPGSLHLALVRDQRAPELDEAGGKVAVQLASAGRIALDRLHLVPPKVAAGADHGLGRHRGEPLDVVGVIHPGGILAMRGPPEQLARGFHCRCATLDQAHHRLRRGGATAGGGSLCDIDQQLTARQGGDDAKPLGPGGRLVARDFHASGSSKKAVQSALMRVRLTMAA